MGLGTMISTSTRHREGGLFHIETGAGPGGPQRRSNLGIRLQIKELRHSAARKPLTLAGIMLYSFARGAGEGQIDE
jgi:hypothetical protein